MIKLYLTLVKFRPVCVSQNVSRKTDSCENCFKGQGKL